ncbi:MAG: serine/threonine protein kinase [Candidatus Zixiibacteriota bacterium]|nr:MAG: serine/threonine protein kinase [candidate division Zixibacteria bacterium]
MAPSVQEKKTVRIGNYVLSHKIGQGGIAEIYRGRQESLGRDVAIKILSAKLSRDPDIVRRFERESMVIARLNHPNIVHVIDKGQAGGRYYFVMEYVDGTSLREVINSDRVPLRTKLEMVAQACKALDYAHKNGVIHRDIKPANILIDRQGNPRVADFGIAQIVGTPETEMTSSDVIMGTLSYMSPEQKVSSTNVDQTTDIYAMGVIIYEILVGKKPLGRFKLPSEMNPEIDPRFDEVIQKCLAQEAKDRFQSAVELKDAILNIIGGAPDESSSALSVQGADSFVGKCRYLDTIKETKFSSTILVENKVTKRLYVIKKHSKGETGRKEAKLLTTLKHPNIINVLGSGGDKKSTVIITEYAQGGALSDRMVRKFDWRRAMEIMTAVASGLDFAHRNNIIHGNIRPSNILFDAEEHPKLTDFGLPPHYDASGKKNWYAPPERKTSKQGDIYSLGVVLHQMLTGRTPAYDYSGGLLVEDFKLMLPEDIIAMLRKLLAIRVSQRYASCMEFLTDWDDFQQRQQEAKTVTAAPPVTAETHERKQVPLWLLLVVTGALIGFIFGLLFHYGAF